MRCRHGSDTSPTTAGGAERKLILEEHLHAAKAREEREHIRTVHHGFSYIMTGRTELAIRRAHESRVQVDRLGMIRALGVALVLLPQVTIKVSVRQTQRDRLAGHALRAAERSCTEMREDARRCAKMRVRK